MKLEKMKKYVSPKPKPISPMTVFPKSMRVIPPTTLLNTGTIKSHNPVLTKKAVILEKTLLVVSISITFNLQEKRGGSFLP